MRGDDEDWDGWREEDEDLVGGKEKMRIGLEERRR